MQMIGGNTQVYGIVGNPVRHTMSPKIHNFLAELLGHDLVYLPFEVSGDVMTAVRGAYELGIRGMNVTVPYKSAVIRALAEVDAEAERIGAVNTLVGTDGGYKGYNTDVTGLRRELQEEGISISGERVIILGAGGAARAAAMMCAADGAREIYIWNRNREKAVNLAEDVKHNLSAEDSTDASIGTVQVQALGDMEYEQLSDTKYIAFQCTPVGLSPHTGEAVIEDSKFYRQLKYAVDLIYIPKRTRYMELAEEAGVYAVNGAKMLIYQAIAAYELWNDVVLSQEVIGQLFAHMVQEGLIE